MLNSTDSFEARASEVEDLPSIDEISALIGTIYDCALDPGLWESMLAGIKEMLRAHNASLTMIDLVGGRASLIKTIGIDPYWLERFQLYGEEMASWERLPALRDMPIDEPQVFSRHLTAEIQSQSPMLKEWGEPQGIVDSIGLTLINSPTRQAHLGLNRHRDAGIYTDREVTIGRILVPHIRRAVTISDLLDMKTVEQQALGATLDSVTAGIVIVASEGRIMHANETAQRMLDAGSPILSSGGCLATVDSRITEELRKAIAMAQEDETQLPEAGLGVPLGKADGVAAIAHILPLARGQRRTRLVPQATAAVFVALDATPLPTDLGAVARMFGLTPAEIRQLEQLIAGATLRKAAAALQVSEATARTHREHIFAKMGVSRQSDLVALVRRLVPPVRRPNGR
ncbi:helix-turn-helix transcriptional regulator [Labrys sp. ZIDIC5]|uniref:helix-turn-helix transcriptional regulator n=1 Tax=Labrys sedimenti TaxID=3106036 RepID=UPI002ACA3DE3|nr:LuxR C-terminal-related transcriptional regulator [Labrys sp. ZIDIC5]MDZ5453449.1 LuxR C-terminal-related transcriptional regulator [Labrys sp. ZIDIC5]